MMRLERNTARMALTLGICLSIAGITWAAEPPSPKLALSFKPGQKSVEVDTPTGDQVEQCQVKVERRGKTSGWVVYGPQGQLLRRFMDTNGDNVVDHWQYYQQGLEVYRDIDSNNNNKIDQCRWLNTAGTRWGLDSNEDGRIDSWKILSAEEAAQLAVQAVIDGDAQALEALLIKPADIKGLGLKKELADQILEAVSDPAAKLRQVRSSSKLLGNQTQWMRFDSANPGLIPADEGKASMDLIVYENAMGIVENDGQAALVQIGEMLRVGDVWKLTQVPQPLEGGVQVVAGGVLMQPASVIPGGGNVLDGDFSPETQKLLTQLQDVDRNAPAPGATPAAIADYNRRRADILMQLVRAADGEQEREQWYRQLVDGLAAAVQTGQYPDGLAELQQVNTTLRQNKASDELMAYVGYRALLSQYAHDLQKSLTDNERRQEIQTWWLEELEKFSKRFPKADEAAEAMLQLAISNEFAGQIDAAKSWYEQTAKNHAQTDSGERADGALRRLNLEGKRLELSGQKLGGGTVDVADYRGKPVLVIFWSTWAKPATEDLPQIQNLYQQYRNRGFEIVGVNLDSTADPVMPYLTEHRVSWPQIHEPGGLESRPAKQFGVISLPTMFLVNKQGVVVSRNITAADLKNELPKLLLE